MLIAKNIRKKYGSIEVLRGINLELCEGEVVALVGSSGAGKTTLLQILGTLDAMDSGELWFGNEFVASFSNAKKADFRNKNLGFVFQFHHLMSEFNALENVCMPAFIAGTSKKEAEKYAKELLAYLHLSERLHHKPMQLSGGEQQRVAVARALMNKPKLILADEPTGNLDTKNGKEMFELFQRLAREQRVSFLVATHNENIMNSADRTIHISDGVIL